MAVKNLGELLLEEGMVTPQQLTQAQAELQAGGGSLAAHLMRLAGIPEESMQYFLALQHGVEYVALEGTAIPSSVISLATREVATRYSIIPFQKTGNQLKVASSDPSSSELLRLKEDMRLDARLEISL